MKCKKFFSIATLVVCAVALAPFAEARNVYLKGGGTTLATQIDLLDDGGVGTAGYATGSGAGTFGAYTTSSLSQINGWDGSSYCSAGVIKLVGLLANGIFQFQQFPGDLLYTGSAPDGVLCYDLNTNFWTFNYTTPVDGGTGIFFGSSGSLTIKMQGRVHLGDAAGNIAFQSFTYVANGNIQLVSRPVN